MADTHPFTELHDPDTYATGVGCRVVRGPDWKWNKQDGGEGHLGSVRRFDTNGEAIVVWDSGIVANYRCGALGFDLRVLDSSPTGTKHPGTICEGCHESPIHGIRWKCVVCLSTDLCSSCYHGDKHALTHQFLRITGHCKTRVIVGRRLKQRRVEALGLFPKARVVRGIDWSWESQDCVSPLASATGTGGLLLSGPGSTLGCRGWSLRTNGESVGSTGPILLPTQGRITDRRDWYPWAPRSAALVAWDSGAYNVYRVGYAGLVDLKAIRASKGGSYYVDHLPLLADLRGCPSEDLSCTTQETTPCQNVDEVADVCRDSSGHILVPNWTNLQDLELRRRQTPICSQETRAQCRPGGVETCTGEQNLDVFHPPTRGIGDNNRTSPISTSPVRSNEPAASSCLNVCTLASRLQLQAPSVESYSQDVATRRSQLRRPTNTVDRDRDLDESSATRVSNTTGNGFRTLGQTARNLFTDFLRPNSSGTTSSIHRGNMNTLISHRPTNSTASRTIQVPTSSASRGHSRPVRSDDRGAHRLNTSVAITRTATCDRETSAIPQMQTHQRRVITNDDRVRFMTLLRRNATNTSEVTGTEGSRPRSGSNSLRATDDTGRSARGRRDQIPRMIYGVYNQLHGLASETITEIDQPNVNDAAGSSEVERRTHAQPQSRPSGGETNEDLIRAAGDGNVKRLKCLLQHRHVNVNATFAGYTALHVACDAGHLACVSLLLQFGAKKRLRDGCGNEAIHAAAQGGNVSIVRLLLARNAIMGSPLRNPTSSEASTSMDLIATDIQEHPGQPPTIDSSDIPDVNSRNALRQTPLHLSVSRHDFSVAQCLLEELNALPNLQDCDGDTPLHDAIAGQSIPLVELLLKHNPDLTITNNAGQNPLHCATVLGDVNIIRVLLQHSLRTTAWLIDEPQPDGQTALHLAAIHGHLEVADLLLQSGANPGTIAHRPTTTGNTVTATAATASPTTARTDHTGAQTLPLPAANLTPLHLAVHKAHPDVVCLLLCHGARAVSGSSSATSTTIASVAGSGESGSGQNPMQLALTMLAQTRDNIPTGQSRRFDVALVPFLASVARLLIRMADTLNLTPVCPPTMFPSSIGMSPVRSRSVRGDELEEEQLISIDDSEDNQELANENVPDDTDSFEVGTLPETIQLVSPSPLCRRLKSTVQATLETGVPRLVLIAACLSSAIGAESWAPNSIGEDDEPLNVETITENFVTDIFTECLDPVLQLALQQCHMEAMNSVSQIRSQTGVTSLGTCGGNSDLESSNLRRQENHSHADLIMGMEDLDGEVNLVDALFRADNPSHSIVSLLPSISTTQNEDTFLLNRQSETDEHNLIHPITIANRLTPTTLNNVASSYSANQSAQATRLLPPSLDEIDSEWRECLVCSENDRSTILSPCGHIITCLNCSSLIKKCLLCRQRITGFVQFSQCCECADSYGVVLSRPCNHMLWCKACLKSKVDQLDVVSIRYTNTQSIDEDVGRRTLDLFGPIGLQDSSVDGARSRTLVTNGTVEWQGVPLGRLMSMVDTLSRLLDDLMVAGLGMDGCPVCRTPIHQFWPIIVSCAGVEHRIDSALVRAVELPTSSITQNPIETIASRRGAPTMNTNERSNDFLTSQFNNPTSSCIPTNPSECLQLNSSPRHQPMMPNNQLDQASPQNELRIRNRGRPRQQLCDRELSKLKHELQVMREQIRCPICLDRSRNLVFMCGHATCQWCGDQVTACPICRRAVQSRIILY